MGIPVKTDQSIRLFGGNLAITYNEAVNKHEVDYGASFTFNSGNAVVGYLSGNGTSTIDWETTLSNPVNVATETLAVGEWIVQSISTSDQSASAAASAISISGIVSAVFDEAALTLTITLTEASNIDDPSQIYIKTTSGTEYQSQVLLSGSDTTTLVFSVIEQVSGFALPGTMSMSASVLLRTSDSLANISISNYPITETPAASSSGTFRNRVLPCIQAAQLNTRTKP